MQYYPCTGAFWALMLNCDGGTSQPMIDVLQALNPLIQPIADPADKCSG